MPYAASLLRSQIFPEDSRRFIRVLAANQFHHTILCIKSICHKKAMNIQRGYALFDLKSSHKYFYCSFIFLLLLLFIHKKRSIFVLLIYCEIEFKFKLCILTPHHKFPKHLPEFERLLNFKKISFITPPPPPS